MTASPLETVPDDILQLIFEASSKDDFIRLCMVNTRFYALLESQVYHTIDWVWENDSTPPITLLLRTLLQRPGLAMNIRNLKLTGETFHLPPFRMKLPPKIPISAPERDGMITVVKRSEVPFTQLWVDMLGGDIDRRSIKNSLQSTATRLATMDATLAVLLSLLTNLTSLYLGPNFTKETTILGAMFKHALCDEKVYGLPSFEMLKDVHFLPRICIERYWGVGGNDIKPENSTCPLTFFSAPAIEHITATIAEPETFKWPGTPPSPSSFTALDITLLREGTLGNILICCSNLDTLAYNFYADKASRHSSDRVQRSLRTILYSSRLISSLSYVESRLKSLVLSTYVTEHDSDGFEGELDGIDTPISFRGTFPQLTNLEVPIVFLLGHEHPERIDIGDVLPRSVRSVTLTDSDFWGQWGNGWDDNYPETQLLDSLEKWFGNLGLYTPLLKEVRVHLKDAWFEFKPEALERFNTMGVEAGLSVEYSFGQRHTERFWPRIETGVVL